MVLVRDHYLCYLCGEPANLVHHIEWITQDNVDDVNVTLNADNLITVCHECHNAIHLNVDTEKITQQFDSFGNLIKVEKQKSKIDQLKLEQLRQQVNPKKNNKRLY